MEEYRAVKIIDLHSLTRHVVGTKGVERQPQIGDIGTIVHVHVPGEAYIVECVDANGHTIWLADFVEAELESL